MVLEAAARRRTYLVHGDLDVWVAFVASHGEKDVFRSFPIPVGAIRSLLPIDADMMVVLSCTKHVILLDIGCGTVLLLDTRFLAMQHGGWWHIHHNTKGHHDFVASGLLMRHSKGPSIHFRSVEVEDERNALAVELLRILFPRQSNVTEFAAGKAPSRCCGALICQPTHCCRFQP